MNPIGTKIVCKELQRTDNLQVSGNIEALKCEVLYTGPDVKQVKVGDFILVGRGAVQTFTYEDETYKTIKEEGVTAIV